ncbi:hypothetical protein SAMN04488516_101456 [Desulfonauticus submarinus]|uniref:DUF503 domain-containing protein n=1 Tax=Desulfonauticus submarinus TaxID=206665 RepID=A0A1H0AL53_9BACT|nr:DUF503 domain-containing protein [Desulfonauticus submarinus]SDN34081.1 hypothetical protein SAMN04488516_101456 [Desulfonauticus submarinus]
MLIGVLKIKFKLHAVFSLKEKRKIAQSLKQKIKNKYNIAIAEVNHQDSLDFLEFGIVTISNKMNQIESILKKVQNYIEAMSSEEIIEIHTDFFGY